MNDELKEIFKKKGLKQNDIAEAVGKSKSVVSEYFRGAKTMPQKVAKKVSEMLGVPIENYLEVKGVYSGHSAKVTAYEMKEGLMGVDSEAHGLHYLLDNQTTHKSLRKLTILVIYQGKEMSIKLDKKMAKAMIDELKDICEMQWEEYL